MLSLSGETLRISHRNDHARDGSSSFGAITISSRLHPSLLIFHNLQLFTFNGIMKRVLFNEVFLIYFLCAHSMGLFYPSPHSSFANLFYFHCFMFYAVTGIPINFDPTFSLSLLYFFSILLSLSKVVNKGMNPSIDSVGCYSCLLFVPHLIQQSCH